MRICLLVKVALRRFGGNHCSCRWTERQRQTETDRDRDRERQTETDIFRLIPDRADEEPCLLEKTIQKNEDELRDRVHGGHPIMIDDALEEQHN